MNRLYITIILSLLSLSGLSIHAAEQITINNPNFDNASNEGWLGDAPNMVGAGDHGSANVAEFWNTTFNTYQDLNGLPDGTYVLRAKTAFRGSWEDFQNGREAAAKLYATVIGQTVEVPFNYMYSCLNTESMSGETYFGTNAGEQSRESDGITYYIPNDPSAFRLYAERGFYDTELYFQVTGGSARIGIKNESMCDDGCDNWSCFDSFTLTYLGSGQDTNNPTNIEQLYRKQEMEVTLTSLLGRYYEGMTANVDVATILQRLGVGSLDDVNIYAVQSNGSLDSNYGLGETDGWRDANGDWKYWTGDINTAPDFYVKSDFTRSSNQLYEVGGYPGKTDSPISYEARYAFVAKNSIANVAVILKVKLNYKESYSADLNDGNYYLKNVATGLFWGAANDWGTRASLVKHPEFITLHKLPDGAYTIESQYLDIGNGSENCYFNGEYMDHDPSEAPHLTIAKMDDGTYTIADGDNYFGYDGTSTVLGKDLGKGNSNARWQILNEAEMQATLNGASAENPIDATFYIKDPNFSRNHRYADAWTMEAENQDLCGGEDNNRCAESWHSVFTLRQQIKNVPNGYYGLIAQGFYRQDGEDNDNLPYFYINDQRAQFLVKGELPDHDGSGWESMGDVSVEFSNGAYTISPIYVQVTDGTITLGARLENNTELWAIWDNFELYYYGDSKPFNDKTFVYKGIKYHTTSDETVEVVGHNGNLSGTVTIPSKVTNGGITYTVTTITSLSGVSNVTTLNLPNTVTSIGIGAFIYSSYVTINLPASLISIGAQAFNACNQLKEIRVNADNQMFCSVDGVLYSKDMKTLYRYPEGKTNESYVVPSPVEILEVSAISGCKSLQSVTLPETFIHAWWYPVEGCSNLKDVVCLRSEPYEEEYTTLFDEAVLSQATLWVPQGCVANYQSRSPWNKFKAIKETPSQITVTAKNCQMEYGDDLPTLEFTTSSGPLTGLPKITCNATKKSKAGTYDIIIEQGTLSSASTLRFINGKLTVKKAPLTVSVSNYTKKQGDPMPTFTITYSGFKNGENENSLTKKPTISCSANESTGPGSYAIVVSGAESPNYTFTYKSATLTVTKADAVIITAKSYTITYGDALPTFEYTVSGGELKGTPSITCSASSRPSAGVYDIIVSKGSVSNYNVSYVKGTLTVTKAPLTVSVDNYSRKEGEANPTFNISYSGFKWNDTVNSLTKKATASCNATATSAPGLYNISVSGAESPNYSFTYKNGTLTVIAIDAIAVKGKNYTITYGESVPNFEYTVEGGTLQGKPSITCSAGSHPAAGIYDIVVSKGSVTNYKVSYVNGTLTVKKAPLTVSVENCTKYKGEANPSFNIKYNGFKWSDNVNSLTKKPTASCEANEWSPAGTYPITLSGAESGNYDFSYVNGTLTVKDVFNMAITPIGNGVVKYNGNTISNYSQFEVKEGENVKLTFVPGNGYQLESFMLNGEDATKSVDNNAYTINNISKDINIVVTFGESQGNFKEGDVRYAILSAPAKTVVVEKSNTYRGHIVIPVSVRHDGTDWNVVGVEDNAFNNCTSLISVELPRSLEFGNVGTSLFVGCTSLAAIIWNPDYAMTSTMLGVVDNPNLLFYAGSSSYVPSGIANAVINEKAKSITLQDVASGNGNFYCPKPFTASTISYTHNYTMESAINGVQGWETLALPFDVQKIEHSREGALIPFIKYHRDNTNERPFWLYTYGSSGFERSGVIAANRAYIICMPNNAEYDSEYRLNGQVTFSSQNVRVESSSWKYTQKKGDKELCPAFCLQKKSADVYALNVSNDLHGETGNRAPGSAFISDLRAVSPFEAYMTTTSGSSRMVIDIEFDDATGIGFPSDSDIRSSRQRIYSLTGQLVFQGDNREEFQKVLRKLPAGVYIINGRKQQIK